MQLVVDQGWVGTRLKGTRTTGHWSTWTNHAWTPRLKAFSILERSILSTQAGRVDDMGFVLFVTATSRCDGARLHAPCVWSMGHQFVRELRHRVSARGMYTCCSVWRLLLLSPFPEVVTGVRAPAHGTAG